MEENKELRETPFIDQLKEAYGREDAEQFIKIYFTALDYLKTLRSKSASQEEKTKWAQCICAYAKSHLPEHLSLLLVASISDPTVVYEIRRFCNADKEAYLLEDMIVLYEDGTFEKECVDEP